jgi:pyruvate, orthophosphate dikinase
VNSAGNIIKNLSDGDMMKYIHFFNENIKDKFELGNKGANLVLMTRLGLPIPPGFIIGIKAYREYHQKSVIPDYEIKEALSELERTMGKKMGKGLEVSVRSSGPVSMPGMMDTILNVNDVKHMKESIMKVFDSWNSPRAVEYRRLNNLSSSLGTAVIIQAMVYGNSSEKSGTGVIFSRNASTGEQGIFGEYLSQAQGEDLVSGSRTPESISKLKKDMPKAFNELNKIAGMLEKYFRDMQDIEFTIESGRLFILQTRSGKRSGHAAIKIAVDMVKEGIITREEAVMRVGISDIEGMLHKKIKKEWDIKPIAKGLNAAPGAVSGRVYFSSEEALVESKKGIPVILVRPETSPDDIQGIAASVGILTQRGGLTSHAAIVARGMGKPCVSGAEKIDVNPSEKKFTIGNLIVKQNDEITIDGSTGYIYLGNLPLEDINLTNELKELMGWADGFKRLGVRANADTAEMIKQAIEFGAEGIGLCRTERMFNAPNRLSIIREFILADDEKSRSIALRHLRELQTNDFIALFKALNGLPIIIRLLDLPLHEFLPQVDLVNDIHVKQRIKELTEINPMLGHRGVRLAVTSPELYKMQIESIEDARKEVTANVSIMIPQVITSQEASIVKRLLENLDMKVGVMMETVRACMRAGRLAKEVDFFSFGTNDLTQAVFSFSREDAEKKFLTTYLELGILHDNPFEILDTKGVGRLMETAIFWARREKLNLEIGVCGEHGGEPNSVRYLHGTGVNYVSCSPFRIPIAKLVAAQSVLASRPENGANLHG